MNKVTRLLAMLDAVFGFGFENKVRSNFKKIRQDFNDRTNEHVIVIECRVQAKGTMQSAVLRRNMTLTRIFADHNRVPGFLVEPAGRVYSRPYDQYNHL